MRTRIAPASALLLTLLAPYLAAQPLAVPPGAAGPGTATPGTATSGSVPSGIGVPSGTVPPTDGSSSIDLRFIGDKAQLGIGYDSTNKLRGDGLLVFGEKADSAWIGEFWVSDRSAGGLKLSYHWRPDGAAVETGVRKLFAAWDQNQWHDRKLTVGGGWEGDQWFGAAYLAAGITGRRETGYTAQTTVETTTGTDAGGIYQQDFLTTKVSRDFQRAYDWGLGLRAGHFFDGPLLRAQVGADYEWGRQSTSQSTVSLGVEKYFAGTPHSVALVGELYWKTGDADPVNTQGRVVAMYRYSFDGPAYRPAQQYRMVPVEIPAVPAAAPVAVAEVVAPPAPTQPRVEKRIVKTTASASTDTFFEFDSAQLRPDGRTALDAVIARLKGGKYEGNLRVVGHTCNIGAAAYNQKLSERRANAVRDYLVAGGLPADRLLAEGMGPREPRFPNDATGRPKNRRVDVEFVTFEDKVEEVVLPPLPTAAPAPVTTTKPAAPPPAPKVEWRREEIATEPAWLRRALRNPVAHKQAVDVYTTVEQSSTTATGEKRYVSRPPVAQPDSYTVNQDTSGNVFEVLGNDSDPDGNPITLASVTTPAHGTAVISGNRVTYTPVPGYVGSDAFSYRIVDSTGLASTTTVSVTVVEVKRPPLAQPDAYKVDQDTSGNVLNVLANDSDPDGEPIKLASVTNPAHGSATVSGNQIAYTPTPGYVGSDSFSYKVTDPGGLSATAQVTITVAKLPHPPVAQGDAYRVNQDTSGNLFDVLANDSDPDGDALSLVSVATPAHGTATISGGRIAYTPSPGFVGTDTFSYKISDPGGLVSTAQVTVTVAAVAHPPVAQGDAYKVNQDTSGNLFDVLVNDSDPDGETLKLASVGTPAHGTATISGNRIAYTPTPGFVGSDTFTYSVTDPGGLSATAQVTVTIAAVAHPPVAQGDAYKVNQDTSGNLFDVLVNDSDPDGEPLKLASVGTPAHGTATISGNRIAYTPTPGFVGTDTFSYQVSDPGGLSATAQVTVTVAAVAPPVNQPPAAQPDSFTVTQDTSGNAFDVLANDSDPDGDVLKLVSVTSPAHGTAVISGTRIVYTPTPGYVGTDSFTYKVADPGGLTSTAQVTVTVAKLCRAPTANEDMGWAGYNRPVTINVLYNDKDPANLPLTVVSFTNGQNGTVVRGPGDRLTYQAKPDYIGFDSFQYTISNSCGATSTARVVVYADP